MIYSFKIFKKFRFSFEIILIDDGEGFGIDMAMKTLKKFGIKNALINGGGQVEAIGKNLTGNKWVVGIRDPLNSNKIIKILKISNQSIETSGNYENRFNYNGKHYGHIMNPKTGTPIETSILSDTVVVDNNAFKYPSTIADILSCSFFILNKHTAEKVLKKLNKNIKVIYISKENHKLYIVKL